MFRVLSGPENYPGYENTVPLQAERYTYYIQYFHSGHRITGPVPSRTLDKNGNTIEICNCIQFRRGPDYLVSNRNP